MGLFKDTLKANKKMNKMYNKVKMNQKISYDELFEIIKDGDFPIGKPAISGSGIMRAIRFEATGKYQIMVSISGKNVMVSKSYSGVKGFAKEVAGDALTDGWYHGVNKENIDGNEAVEMIGIEISKLLGKQGFLAN